MQSLVGPSGARLKSPGLNAQREPRGPLKRSRVDAPTACGPRDLDHSCALVAVPGPSAGPVRGVADSDREHENRQHVRVNGVSEKDRRLIGLWAADCASRVLPLFEAKAPCDTVFARQSRASGPSRGGKRAEQLRSLA